MNCFVFDIDGVIVDLETKIPDAQVIQKIIKILEKQTPVSFVSGRSSLWIVKNIIQLLKENLNDEKLLDNILILGEFGSSITKYHDSKIISVFNDKHTLPTELINQASEIAEKYLDTLKIDDTKQTQFSLEMNDGLDIEKDFKPVQKIIVQKYNELLKKFELDNILEVKEDKIGINIKSKNSNKNNAMKILSSWILEKNLNVERFFVFGDSASDLQMGDGLEKAGAKFEFVFVGKKNELPQNISFPVHISEQKFEKGTLEFLNSHFLESKQKIN